MNRRQFMQASAALAVAQAAPALALELDPSGSEAFIPECGTEEIRYWPVPECWMVTMTYSVKCGGGWFRYAQGFMREPTPQDLAQFRDDAFSAYMREDGKRG